MGALALSLVSVVSTSAQVNLGNNPILGSGSLSLGPTDYFTGTFGISGATLNLSNNFVLPVLTTISFSGTTTSYLSYGSGGPYTLYIPLTSSFTRSGSNYTYVYDHINNSGTFTVSGGTVQFQTGTTFTNTATGTATVTGSSSVLYLIGLANAGAITVDNNGIVQLAGNYTTANLGAFTITNGGSVKLSGALNNASANLTAPTSGAYTLYGGTIAGGTIDSAALKFSSSGGILDGAVITGNVALGSAQTLTLKNNAGFTGTATVTDGTVYLGSNLTATAGSAYVFTGTGSYLSNSGGGPYTLTLPTGTSLTRSGTGYTYLYESIANAGTITVSGGNLQFQSGTTLTNSGTTTVTGNGSTLYLYGLANTGSLVVDSLGLIQLAGSYTTANLGSFSISTGGVAKLTGLLNNTSANLATPAAGAFTLSGGTITGGTITPAALIFSSSGGILDGAVISGNLSLPSGQSVTLKNGAGFTGTATINNSTLYLGSNLTAANGTAYVFTGAGSYLSNSGGGPYTLTLPSGTSLTRSGAGYTYVYEGINNAGTVTVSGGNLQFQSGTTFTNSATTTVTGSGSTLYLLGLANSGTLIADNLGLIQLAGSYLTSNLGTFSISNGGLVKLTGTLTNTSANLTAPTGGAYTLTGGTITGGTIDSAALAFSGSGTLDGAVITGNLNLVSSEALTLKNAAGFTGTGNIAGTLYLGTNLTAAVGNTYAFSGTGSYLSYTGGGPFTFTLPSGASLTRSGTGYTYVYTNVANAGTTSITGGQLQFQTGATFTNSGTTTITGAGSSLYLYGLANTGSISADAGLIQLAGSYATADLGSIALTNGAVLKLTGSLNNASATLAAPSGGTYTLYGGTITGGSVANGALTFTSSGANLNGVTLLDTTFTLPASALLTFTGNSSFSATNLAFGSGSTFNWNQTGTLTGKTITMGAASAFAYWRVPTSAALTLGSTSTIGGVFDIYSNGGAFTNYGAINANNGTSYLYGTSTTNSGTILTNSGASLYLGYYSSDAVTNTSGGILNVTGTGSQLFLRNLVNQGTVQAQNNGTLYFQGNHTTANLGTVQLSSGGRALFTGALDNSSATLNAPSGGIYQLAGGTITGGTVAANALTFTSSGGSLSGVNLLGDLSFATSAYAYFSNSTTLSGSNLTLAGSSTLYWDQTGTLSGQTITAGTGTSYAYVRVTSGETLTLGSNSSLSGVFDLYTNSNGAFINLGSITANAGTSYLYGPSNTNSGNITATSGGSLYLGYYSTDAVLNATGGNITATGTGSNIIFQNPVNQGTMTATANGTIKLTGNYTTANLGLVNISTGGLVELAGALVNTASNLVAPNGGAFTLFSAVITGGTIDAGALTFSSSGGTLDGAVITGNALVSSGQFVTLKNGGGATGTFSVDTGGIALGSNLSLTSAFVFSGSGSYLTYDTPGRTLTLVSGGSLTRTGVGYSYGYVPIVNGGAISIAGGSFSQSAAFTNAGGNLTVAPTTFYTQSSSAFVQTSGSLVINGQFNAGSSGLSVQGGTVSGTGTITGNTTVTGGSLNPGNPTGTLQLLGNLSLGSGATTVMELDLGSADRITGITTLTLGGQLNIIALTTSFSSGQTWNLFSANAITGSFSSINLPYLSSGWIWDTSQLTTTGNLTLATFVPVPEPSTYLLIATGLGVIFVMHRRRRR